MVPMRPTFLFMYCLHRGVSQTGVVTGEGCGTYILELEVAFLLVLDEALGVVVDVCALSIVLRG